MKTAIESLADTAAALGTTPWIHDGERTESETEAFVRHVLAGTPLTGAQQLYLTRLLLATVLELRAEVIRLRSRFPESQPSPEE